MNKPGMFDRSKYIPVSPKLARLLSAAALAGMYLSFLLGIMSDDGDEVLAAIDLLAALVG